MTTELLAQFGLVLIGLVMLYFGAEWLVRGSITAARMLGVSALLIGLTVVAFGTSAPEMFVCISLAKDGHPGTAVGNIVGSNICNILLMLGFAAVMRPLTVSPQIVVRELPILLGASLLFVLLIRDGNLVAWEGLILFIGIIVYLVVSGVLAKSGKPPELIKHLQAEVGIAAEPPKSTLGHWIRASLLIVGGIAVLAVGAESLKRGALYLAEYFGVNEAIIGLTLIAVGTSLPEIATSIVASIRKHGDIITGNAIGSCTFNILAVMGVVPLITPLRGITGIQNIDLIVMVAVVIIAIPFLRTRWRLSRWEGIVFLIAYFAYCGSLIQRGA